MKAKRQHIGTFFLLLAGVVLFAHAVIPHHHHRQQVCLQHHAQAHNLQDEYDSGASNHHPNGTSSSYCLLNQYIVIPNNPWKQECNCENASHIHAHDVAVLVFNYVSSGFTLPEDADKVFPEPLPRYFSYPAVSIGLRAPPAV